MDPLGRYLLVDNIPFQVVGVMTAKGATPFGTDQDDVVFVPLSTGSLRLFGQRHLRSITVQVADVARIDETQAAITALLDHRHHRQDTRNRNLASLLAPVSETQRSEEHTTELPSLLCISYDVFC